MKRWKKGNEKECVCVNLGHCYTTGERTSSIGFQLGPSWHHAGTNESSRVEEVERALISFRRMCVKVKYNNV